MTAYAVKHLPDEHEDVTKSYKKIRKAPFSFTSKRYESKMAASNNYIYVIQREKIGRETIYKLAYRFRCSASYQLAGGEKWLGLYQHKNTVKYGEDACLEIMNPPIEITDKDFNIWYKGQTLGMCEIPKEYVKILEQMFQEDYAVV